jgi:hypothetical protein
MLNNRNQIALLETAIETGEFPKSIQFQIRAFEKRYSDVATISSLSTKLIESEKTKLNQQNQDTNIQLMNGPTELHQMLQPILDNSDTFKHMLNNAELLLNSLIEQEFCTMLLKMEHDKKVKEAKKTKFETQKAMNNSAAFFTTKQMKQMTSQINHLKKELAKLSTKPKSKNGKGKPAPKKSGKPTQTKGGNLSKTRKGNGNTKNTRKDRQ